MSGLSGTGRESGSRSAPQAGGPSVPQAAACDALSHGSSAQQAPVWCLLCRWALFSSESPQTLALLQVDSCGS